MINSACGQLGPLLSPHSVGTLLFAHSAPTPLLMFHSSIRSWSLASNWCLPVGTELNFSSPELMSWKGSGHGVTKYHPKGTFPLAFYKMASLAPANQAMDLGRGGTHGACFQNMISIEKFLLDYILQEGTMVPS